MLPKSPASLSTPCVLGLLCLFIAPSAARAADLQDRLNALYRGSQSILLLETHSTCDDSYTNNRVIDGRVASPRGYRIPAGELGRVSKVDVKRARIDILIDIEEPVLISWTDGPFHLYDQARCRVELVVEVPRLWVKKTLSSEVEALLAGVLERHEDRVSASESAHWNRRAVGPLPDGHEQVRLEYQAWRAGQLRRDLLSTLDEALRAAQRVIDRAVDDPAYGAGLAEGMETEASRYRSWGHCEGLAKKSFYPGAKDAADELEESDASQWERAYRDGQVLAFNVELARRIGACLAL